jgi:integrase
MLVSDRPSPFCSPRPPNQNRNLAPSAVNCTGNSLGPGTFSGDQKFAINFTDNQTIAKTEPASRVWQLVNNSISPNTKRAYRADLDHFHAFGGTIPSSAEQIAGYVAALGDNFAIATIHRRLASLSRAHAILGTENPVRSELVRATMRGLRRVRGVSQRHATPLLREDLFAVLEGLGSQPKDMRDKALLLLGFAGAFRRSELVALNTTDIENVRQGTIVNIRRSKTDQDGVGRQIGIPFGRSKWCPVRCLEDWLTFADIGEGPLFLGVGKGGLISKRRLSADAVSKIIKAKVAALGFDPMNYSGHSLRAGLATSAAMAGVPTWKIRQQTGHASDLMLARYIRPTEMFENNAAGSVL